MQRDCLSHERGSLVICRGSPTRPTLDDITLPASSTGHLSNVENSNDATLWLDHRLVHLEPNREGISPVTSTAREDDKETKSEDPTHHTHVEKPSSDYRGAPGSLDPRNFSGNNATTDHSGEGQNSQKATASSSSSTNRAAVIAGGAAGAAAVAVIAVGLFVLLRRRRARRKRMAALVRRQQEEYDAQCRRQECHLNPFADPCTEDFTLAIDDHPSLNDSVWSSPVPSICSPAQVHSKLPHSHYQENSLHPSSTHSSPVLAHTIPRHSATVATKKPAAFISPRKASYKYSCEGSPFYHPDLGPEYYTGFPIVIPPSMQQQQQHQRPRRDTSVTQQQQHLPPLPPPPSHSILPLPHDPERYRFYYEQASNHPLYYHNTTHSFRPIIHHRALPSFLPPHPTQPLPPRPASPPHSTSHVDEHHYHTIHHFPQDAATAASTGNSLKAAIDLMNLHHDLNDHSPSCPTSLPPPPRTARSPPPVTRRPQALPPFSSESLQRRFLAENSSIDKDSLMPVLEATLSSTEGTSSSVTTAATAELSLTVQDDAIKPTTLDTTSSSTSTCTTALETPVSVLTRPRLSRSTPTLGCLGSPSSSAPQLSNMATTTVRRSLCYNCPGSPALTTTPLSTPQGEVGTPFSLSHWCSEMSAQSNIDSSTPPMTSFHSSATTTYVEDGGLRPPSAARKDVCCDIIIVPTCCDEADEKSLPSPRQGEMPFGPLSPMP